jgi:hypothetical protein
MPRARQARRSAHLPERCRRGDGDALSLFGSAPNGEQHNWPNGNNAPARPQGDISGEISRSRVCFSSCGDASRYSIRCGRWCSSKRQRQRAGSPATAVPCASRHQTAMVGRMAAAKAPPMGMLFAVRPSPSRACARNQVRALCYPPE